MIVSRSSRDDRLSSIVPAITLSFGVGVLFATHILRLRDRERLRKGSFVGGIWEVCYDIGFHFHIICTHHILLLRPYFAMHIISYLCHERDGIAHQYNYKSFLRVHTI